MSDEAAAGDHTYVKQRVPNHKPNEVDEETRRDLGHSFLARGGFALAATMPPLIQKVGRLFPVQILDSWMPVKEGI